MSKVPQVPPVRFVLRPNGAVKGYSVVTHRGLLREYNEDRVSIIMSITKQSLSWPSCSYFGLFDGHGGSACSDFLKDNLHRFITDNPYFPSQPVQAMAYGFERAEREFLKMATETLNTSGSCAIVLLIIDKVCYVGNVGDSRAVLSMNNGRDTVPISQDHKPERERERIVEAGGQIYQSYGKNSKGQSVKGPYRISPGKLSVSRAFGDVEAKLPQWKGNPRVLIARPEVSSFAINTDKHDFIVLCSDGVYDRMSNREVTDCFWEEGEGSHQNYEFVGRVPCRIVKRAMEKYSTDNLTALVIMFEEKGRVLEHCAKENIRQNYISGKSKDKENNNNNIINNIINKNKIILPQREKSKKLTNSKSMPMMSLKYFQSKRLRVKEGLR